MLSLWEFLFCGKEKYSPPNSSSGILCSASYFSPLRIIPLYEWSLSIRIFFALRVYSPLEYRCFASSYFLSGIHLLYKLFIPGHLLRGVGVVDIKEPSPVCRVPKEYWWSFPGGNQVRALSLSAISHSLISQWAARVSSGEKEGEDFPLANRKLCRVAGTRRCPGFWVPASWSSTCAW